jgi:hypothetical protein
MLALNRGIQQGLILLQQVLGYGGGESCRNTSIELFKSQR